MQSGAVAFLFSDIEGSTRRWERYGEAMREALHRHDTILRSAIDARRGHVFKTMGDAFFAVFPTASDALGAAIEAQRRLGREDFGAVDGLSVRMALHSGEAEARDGDYFGATLNRTARLLSAGHGGQVLLSGDAADRVLPLLPPGITLRHLGTVPLKDVNAPERVYQPVGEGLRAEFKALRALQTPPNNLPRQTTSFVGRYDDIARVEALLDEGPLLTLAGAGGIGKTRLALEVAANRLNDVRDGAWLADLSAVGDPALIAGTILSSVGGEATSDRDPLDDLLAHLDKRELLLVLDNSEHLVSAVAAIVAQIVARCPHVTVLATSRSPLDISAERVYRLSTLDDASSVALFADRARAANPAFSLDAKRSAVETICRRLDGIALGIELAAARVRSMSIESLASHLELRLLHGGRDRRPRQQTMRALVGWSYDLLDEREQRVLRHASVFLRGFTLGAATRVCGEGDDEWPVLEALTSLVDKSLVIADAGEREERYRILEPIREYAWEKLGEAGEVEPAQRRHAEALLALAAAWYAEWDDGPAADWLERVDRDLANMRAALRWSAGEGNDPELGARLAGHATIAFLRLALPSEGLAWCAAAEDCGAAMPDDVRARLHYGMSMLYSTLAQDAACLREAEIAATFYRNTEDRRGLARALSQVASRHAWQARYGQAKVAAEEALAIVRAGRDARLLADVLRRCAGAFTDDGPDRVRASYAESVALFSSLGRDDETARVRTWWGQWEEAAGNYAQAVAQLLEAARLDTGDGAVMFHSVDIAGCYLAMGERARAEPFARKGLAAAAKAGHWVGASLTVAHLAVVASETDAPKAARLLGYASRRFEELAWELEPIDAALVRDLRASLAERFEDGALAALFAQGAAWSDDQAVTHALSI